MGFGHRIYRTEDPRARLLRSTAQQLGGERIDLALHVEAVARRLLRERKPDRVLDVNVEYHAAVVLEAVGLPRALFTPTFALSRAVGWTAHALEQMDGNRIVRPTSRYVGPALRPVP
jgi:citrate synthase